MLTMIHHIIGEEVMHIIESVKEVADELFCWFAKNQMKANPDKCHLIKSSICIENFKTSGTCEKLFIYAN